MRTLNKKVAAVATAGALVATTGIAYAYWTTSGSGTGEGATTAGVVNQLGFVQDQLTPMFPGDRLQDLAVTVTNNSTQSAYVSTVKAYVVTDKPGCTGADFLLDGAAAPSDAAGAKALAWAATDLRAGGSADATGTIQFNNTTGNQDVCKGAAVTVHYLAS